MYSMRILANEELRGEHQKIWGESQSLDIRTLKFGMSSFTFQLLQSDLLIP